MFLPSDMYESARIRCETDAIYSSGVNLWEWEDIPPLLWSGGSSTDTLIRGDKNVIERRE